MKGLLRRAKRALRGPFRRRRYARLAYRPWPRAERAALEVSILLATYNRAAFLRELLAGLLRDSGHERIEVLIRDNASTDETPALLAACSDRRIKVYREAENIGLNAYPWLAERASGSHLLQLDDDVIHFPDRWLGDLLFAFTAVERMGYLAAGVVQDAYTSGGRNPAWRYQRVWLGPGADISFGATGQWCTLTSRAQHDEVGGYARRDDTHFFWGDRDYRARLRAHGYHQGILEDLRVYHAYGPHCNESFAEHYREKMAELSEGDRTVWAPRGGFWPYFRARYDGR